MRRRFKISFIIALLLLLISHYVIPYQICMVQGTSMEYALHDKQIIIVDKKDRTCDVEDIVVFKFKGITYIKRVVAKGSCDVYLLKDESTKQIMSVYSQHEYQSKKHVWDKINNLHFYIPRKLYKKHVPSNYIFAVGDAYGASTDSREYGAVPISCVIGTVVGDYPIVNQGYKD